MPNKIPYTIELLVDDSKLRQTMADLDWEKILGSKKGATSLKEALKNGTEEGVKYAKQALGGLDVNWSEILGEEGLKQFQKAVTKSITQNKNALQKMINANDGKGIEEIIGKVIELGEFLTSLGSAFDSKRLMQNLGAFLTTLGRAEGVMANISEVSSQINTAFGGIAKVGRETTSVTIELDKVLKSLGGDTSKLDKNQRSLQDYKDLLKDITGKKYTISLDLDDDILEEEFEYCLQEIEDKRNTIDDLVLKLKVTPDDSSSQDKLVRTQKELAHKLLEAYDYENERLRRGMTPILGVAGETSSKELISEAKAILKEFQADAKKVIGNLSTIQLDLTLPEYQSFIPKINDFVDKLNTKSAEFHKINLTAGLVDDALNPIEDKKKRAQQSKNGLNPADDDVVMNNLIKKTSNRFSRLTSKITEKQNQILESTQKWRADMIAALSFKVSDVTFEIDKIKPAQELYEAIDSYFEEYPINIPIDVAGLVDQIKRAVEESGISLNVGSMSGTASLDATTIKAMIESVIGVPMSTFISTTEVDTSVEESTDAATESTRKYVKTIDEIPAHVDQLVETVKAFAKITIPKLDKDGKPKALPKGIATVKNWLEAKGIKVSEIADETSPDVIKQMLQDTLLTMAKDGSATGSMLADSLQQIINNKNNNIDITNSNGKIIEALKNDIAEVLNMGDIKQESWDEWWKRQMAIELSEEALGAGKALNVLNKVRGKKGSQSIPALETIQKAIDIFAEQGLDNTDLLKLKEAREALGDSEDEQDIAKFREAKAEFFDKSKDVVITLNKLFGDFQGRITIAGKTFDIDGKHRGAISKVGKLPKGQITNAKVYSYLEGKALDDSLMGSTQYRDRNWRKARRQEERWLKGDEYTHGRSPYLSDKPASFNSGTVNILDKAVVVSDFVTLEERKAEEVTASDFKLSKEHSGKKLTTTEKFDELSKQQSDIAKAANDKLSANNKQIDEIDSKLRDQQSKVEQAKKAAEQVAPKNRESIDIAALQEVQQTLFQKQSIIDRVTKALASDNDIQELTNRILEREDLQKKADSQPDSKESRDAKEKLAKLPVDTAVSGETAENIKTLNTLIQERIELQKQRQLLDEIDIDEAKKRLEGFKNDERRAMELRDPNRGKELTYEDEAWLKSFDDIVKKGEKTRELYSKYISNPDAIKNQLDQQITELSRKELEYKSFITEWAKTEIANIPEAISDVAKVAKPIINQFKSEMANAYNEAIEIKEKLSDPNLSTEERDTLIGRLQNTLTYYQQLNKQYQELRASLPKDIDTKELLLGKTKHGTFDELTDRYINQTNSVVDTRNDQVKNAEADKKHLEAQKESLKEDNKQLEKDKKLAEFNRARFEQIKLISSLKEQEIELQAELNKLLADNPSNPKIETLKHDLNDVNNKLTEARNKLEELGGDKSTTFSDKEKKQYALDEAQKYQRALVDLRAQKYVAQSKQKGLNSDKEEFKKWGFSAGLGKRRLDTTKRDLLDRYMSSDYVDAQVDAIKDKVLEEIGKEEAKANQQINTEEAKIREKFDKKVVEAMTRAGLNHMDEDATRNFLANDTRGKQLATNFTSEIETNKQKFLEPLDTFKKGLWEKFELDKKALLTQLKEDFLETFKNTDYQTATFKKLDDDGKWVDDLEFVNLRKKIEDEFAAKQAKLDEHKPEDIDKKIAQAEIGLKSAIKYGGLDDTDVYNKAIIEEQIDLRNQKYDAEQRLIRQQETLNTLKAAGLADDDKDVKAARLAVALTEEQIKRYDLLIANRDKLIAARNKGAQGTELSTEEKRLIAVANLTKLEAQRAKSKEKILDLEKRAEEAKGTENEAEAAKKLADEKERQLELEGKIQKAKQRVVNTTKQAEEEKKSTQTISTRSGGIIGAIKEALANVQIDTSKLATEKTLSAIKGLLSGEHKPVSETAPVTNKPDPKVSSERAKQLNKTAYNELAVKDEETGRKTLKYLEDEKECVDKLVATVNTLKQLTNENKQDTDEYIVAQRKLGLILGKYYKLNPQKIAGTGKDGNLKWDDLKANDALLQKLGVWNYNPITSDKALVKLLGASHVKQEGEEQVDKQVIRQIIQDNNKQIESLTKSLQPLLATEIDDEGIKQQVAEVVSVIDKLQKDTQKQESILADIAKSDTSESTVDTPEKSATKPWTKSTTYDFDPKFAEGDDVSTRRNKLQEAMQAFAQADATANKLKYAFQNFDGKKLIYTLTDVDGHVRNVTLEWNELNKQVAITSDKSVATIDPLITKVQEYRSAIDEAKEMNLLPDNADKKFAEAEREIEEIKQKILNGDVTSENFIALDKAREKAISFGESLNKVLTGMREIKTATTQYNKIIGTTGINVGSEHQSQLAQQYKEAYDRLINNYKRWAAENKLNNPDIQQQLQQQLAGVKKLGSAFMSAAEKAAKLQSLVDGAKTYTDRFGDEHALSGTKQLTTGELQDITGAMQAFAKSLYGVRLEKVNLNTKTMTLTGALRQNDRVVSDIAIQYNNAKDTLYAYQVQEHESLTGLPGLIHGFKEKRKAILQYVASMTSIYRIFGFIKQGIQQIKEIDTALTELKKVTDETSESYERFIKTAAKTADKVGSTITKLVNSAADWSRIGYSLEEAATLAESTAVLLNVSEFTNIEDATSALTSTLQAFGYTAAQSMDVVDVLNEVGK